MHGVAQAPAVHNSFHLEEHAVVEIPTALLHTKDVKPVRPWAPNGKVDDACCTYRDISCQGEHDICPLLDMMSAEMEGAVSTDNYAVGMYVTCQPVCYS